MRGAEDGQRRLVVPNVVVVGVSRAGTTSMFNALARHPDVCGSDIKEVRYFTPLRYGQPLAPLEEYARHFRQFSGERIVVEATPGYFYGGRATAATMNEVCPGVRAVVSLREPKSRCWSWFRFVKSRGRIAMDMSFSEYLDRCEQLSADGTDGDFENQAYWGLGGGCYSDWLDDWMSELGDRLRVILFDDFVRDPHDAMKQLAAWLEIEAGAFDTYRLNADNQTALYRNRALQMAAVRMNRDAERFFRRHPKLKRRLRRAYYLINKAEDERSMTEADEARLRDFYEPYNAVLRAQAATIGLALPRSWQST
jgi:hypothetical protein